MNDKNNDVVKFQRKLTLLVKYTPKKSSVIVSLCLLHFKIFHLISSRDDLGNSCIMVGNFMSTWISEVSR